ncbi:histidinol-phosphatase [Bacteroidales bacterium Barb6]|nr:histidinol-phosphatase [Bacteroidales bacterium Barb6]
MLPFMNHFPFNRRLLSNYHSHSTFCDGRGTPEEFLRFALSNGFRAYGFSSHSPLPFETFWNMSKSDMPEYLAETERLKGKYGHRLEVYAGLEIDYLDGAYNPSIPYFQELPLDYRIGSVHFLPLSEVLTESNMVCIDGGFTGFDRAVEEYFGGNVRRLVERYYSSVQRMVATGGFDVVGHIDKVCMNGQLCHGFSFDAGWYRKAFADSLALVAEKGLMVEINTKNMLPKRQTYPRIQFYPLLREMKIPVLVSSDCHIPHLVNDGRAEALALLREAGFRSVRELVGGTWQDVGISSNS